MNAIRATWTEGRIVPTQPVNWPEGSELLVAPLYDSQVGMREEDWRDDPDSIAAWVDAVQKLEPMIWAEGEREQYDQYRVKCREINLEAVRKQMQETPCEPS